MTYKKPFITRFIPIFLALGVFLSLYTFLFASSKKEMFADQVIANSAKKIAFEKHLHPIGNGSQMLDDIEMLSLGFQCFEKLNINKARDLIVYSVKTFITGINDDKEIRPYLKSFPFTPKNVEIEIYCYQPNGSDVPIGELEYITSIDGIINYYPEGPDKYKTEKPILTETYEEALSILNK